MALSNRLELQNLIHQRYFCFGCCLGVGEKCLNWVVFIVGFVGRLCLLESLKGLKDRIEALELERASLCAEVERLRRAAEARVVALEGEVGLMREEAGVLRGLLGSDDKVGRGSVSKSTAGPVAEASTPSVPESKQAVESVESSVSAGTDTEDEDVEAVFGVLGGDERKVVDILLMHGGRFGQKDIRVEAGLSWLAANRVISGLVDRGVVSLEKNGVNTDVLLKEKAK